MITLLKLKKKTMDREYEYLSLIFDSYIKFLSDCTGIL